jgi:Mn-dependent DtxR family transcriptional regulator
LGTDAETAEEDACRIEHVISDKTFEIVKKHITETEAVSNETAPS